MSSYDVHAKQQYLIPKRFEKGQISGIWHLKNVNLATLCGTAWQLVTFALLDVSFFAWFVARALTFFVQQRVTYTLTTISDVYDGLYARALGCAFGQALHFQATAELVPWTRQQWMRTTAEHAVKPFRFRSFNVFELSSIRFRSYTNAAKSAKLARSPVSNSMLFQSTLNTWAEKFSLKPTALLLWSLKYRLAKNEKRCVVFVHKVNGIVHPSSVTLICFRCLSQALLTATHNFERTIYASESISRACLRHLPSGFPVRWTILQRSFAAQFCVCGNCLVSSLGTIYLVATVMGHWPFVDRVRWRQRCNASLAEIWSRPLMFSDLFPSACFNKGSCCNTDILRFWDLTDTNERMESLLVDRFFNLVLFRIGEQVTVHDKSSSQVGSIILSISGISRNSQMSLEFLDIPGQYLYTIKQKCIYASSHPRAWR